MRVFRGILFWLVSFTWGIVMSLIGAIVALILLAAGHKPKIFKFCVYFEVGNNWGAVSFGAFFFASKESSEDTKFHEISHGIQNIFLGIFFPFIIGIPSLLWAWFIQDLVNKNRKNKGLKLLDYYWFYTEKNAEWIKTKYLQKKEQVNIVSNDHMNF